MKYVYTALIVAFTAIVLTFKVQNLDSVTVSLASLSLTMPMSALVALVYVLGMLSGGFVVKPLRTWVRGATARKA